MASSFTEETNIGQLVVFVTTLVCYAYWQEASSLSAKGEVEAHELEHISKEESNVVAQHATLSVDDLATEDGHEETHIRARSHTMPPLSSPISSPTPPVDSEILIGHDTKIHVEEEGWLAPQLPPFSGKTMNVVESRYVTEQLIKRRRAASIGDLNPDAGVFGLKSIDMSASPAPDIKPPTAPETPTRRFSGRSAKQGDKKPAFAARALGNDLTNTANTGVDGNGIKPAASFDSADSIPLQFNFTTAPSTPAGIGRKESPTKVFGLERHPSRKLPSSVAAADARGNRVATPPQVSGNRRVSLERRPSSRSMHPLLDPDRVKPASATVAQAQASFMSGGTSLWDHDHQLPTLKLFGEEQSLAAAVAGAGVGGSTSTTTPAIPIPGSWLPPGQQRGGSLTLDAKHDLPVLRGRTVSEVPPISVRTPSSAQLLSSIKPYGSVRT